MVLKCFYVVLRKCGKCFLEMCGNSGLCIKKYGIFLVFSKFSNNFIVSIFTKYDEHQLSFDVVMIEQICECMSMRVVY